MSLDKLKSIEDLTGDFDKAIDKCILADDYFAKGLNNECIELYCQAAKTIIRNVYKRQNLKGSVPFAGPNESLKVWVHNFRSNSSFTSWINDKQTIDAITIISNIEDKKDKSRNDAVVVKTQFNAFIASICKKMDSQIKIINPEVIHLPCVILLDISASMLGLDGTKKGQRPIDILNNTIHILKDELTSRRDINAATEISVITFNDSVEAIQAFKNPNDLNIPILHAEGRTSLNEAIETSLTMIEKQKTIYRREEVNYYRPWLFVISDWRPTDIDKEHSAKDKLQQAILDERIEFYPVQTGSTTDTKCLLSYYPESYSDKKVIIAEEGHFSDLFRFFSNSIKDKISHSKVIGNSIRTSVDGIRVEWR